MRRVFPLVIVAFLANAAFAQSQLDSPPVARDCFNAFDRNLDGVLSGVEVNDPAISDTWRSADRNRDGHLDTTEFNTFYTTSIDMAGKCVVTVGEAAPKPN